MSTGIGPLEGGATYYVDSEDGSISRVRFVVTGRFRGPLRFTDRLLARMLTRDAAAVCRNLKAVLEADPAVESYIRSILLWPLVPVHVLRGNRPATLRVTQFPASVAWSRSEG